MINRIVSLAIAFTVIIVAEARSQETPPKGSVGITASLQGGQFDILVPWWLGETFSLAPGIGIAWMQDLSTNISLGIVPRFYLRKERIATYVGARAGVLLTSPAEGESTTDILVGGSLGGEYYLDPRFCLGVEAQLNATINDERSATFGNPGNININTAAAVFATVYF
jgi:hypothetical protein